MKVIDDILLDRLALTKLPDLKDVIVTGAFFCKDNNLTSLEGAPKFIGNGFWCSRNNLTSLEGAPKFVGGDFWCYNNKVNFTEEYVRSLVKVKGKVFV